MKLNISDQLVIIDWLLKLNLPPIHRSNIISITLDYLMINTPEYPPITHVTSIDNSTVTGSLVFVSEV